MSCCPSEGGGDMDWRDASRYLGRLVIYTDQRNEKHIYRLQARKKYNTGKIFAELKDLRCDSIIRADFERLMLIGGGEDYV